MAKITTDSVSNDQVNKEPAVEAVTHTGKTWLNAFLHRPS